VNVIHTQTNTIEALN